MTTVVSSASFCSPLHTITIVCVCTHTHTHTKHTNTHTHTHTHTHSLSLSLSLTHTHTPNTHKQQGRGGVKKAVTRQAPSSSLPHTHQNHSSPQTLKLPPQTQNPAKARSPQLAPPLVKGIDGLFATGGPTLLLHWRGGEIAAFSLSASYLSQRGRISGLWSSFRKIGVALGGVANY